MVVRVGGESVSFPRPDTVVGDTRASGLIPGQDPTLELSWTTSSRKGGGRGDDASGDEPDAAREADDTDAESTTTVTDGGD
jgi:hypothetical protein